MKKLITVIVFMAAAQWAAAQTLSGPPSGDNQKAKVIQYVGPVEISIAYSSPDVHGPNGEDRKGKIWGEVAHYGYSDQGGFGVKEAPYRAGANENTVFSVSHDVKIDGKDLKAGKYALFLVVAKDGPWTWIFSKNHTSWGSYFYNPAEDALRVQVNPQDAPYTEWLTYGFDDRLPSSTQAYLQWDNKRIPFKVEVPNVNELYVAQMRNELRSSPGFDSRNWATAAQFCATNKINLEEALTWMDNAMNPGFGGAEDFTNLSIKANILTAMGKEEEANQLMDKAIKVPNTPVGTIHQYARGLLNAGKKEKAMEVFQFNAKSHPEEKFTTNVGLARGYSAVGDKKNAIKHWELAIKNIPPAQENFRSVYEGELKKLKDAK